MQNTDVKKTIHIKKEKKNRQKNEEFFKNRDNERIYKKPIYKKMNDHFLEKYQNQKEFITSSSPSFCNPY